LAVTEILNFDNAVQPQSTNETNVKKTRSAKTDSTTRPGRLDILKIAFSTVLMGQCGLVKLRAKSECRISQPVERSMSRSVQSISITPPRDASPSDFGFHPRNRKFPARFRKSFTEKILNGSAKCRLSLSSRIA
jgi:hypothetical protein